LADADLGVHEGLHANCEVPLLEAIFTVPVANKVHIIVLSNRHSKIYISESVYFFFEDPVFL